MIGTSKAQHPRASRRLRTGLQILAPIGAISAVLRLCGKGLGLVENF